MSALAVVIDPGNFSTKFVYRWKGEETAHSFSSIAHPYEEMDTRALNEIKRVNFKQFDYYIGKGAARFHASDRTKYMGNTRKGHHEGIIRIIAALHEVHRDTGATTFNIMVTSPYSAIQSDRTYFERMLKGNHQSIVDGKEFNFTVQSIRMAAEGLGALAFTESRDCVILDAGSMTMNILYLIDGAINAARSTTLNGGTIKNKPFNLAATFLKACPDVDYDKLIMVTGGEAEKIAEALKDVGYDNVKCITLEDYPAFYVNVVGLFMAYERKFEVMFANV